MAWAESLWEGGGRRVLDLGCGVGRNTISLTRLGFAVTATDVSSSGLTICAARLAHEELSATLVLHEMETLPFTGCTFDGLIAFNVIHHTSVAGMRRVLAEVRRVLCLGGRLYFTATARDEDTIAHYRADVETGKCLEIEPFTFVYVRDGPGDKHLPHHYCDEAELSALLAGFTVDDLRLVCGEYTDDDGMIRTSRHYHVQARRF